MTGSLPLLEDRQRAPFEDALDFAARQARRTIDTYPGNARG